MEKKVSPSQPYYANRGRRLSPRVGDVVHTTDDTKKHHTLAIVKSTYYEYAFGALVLDRDIDGRYWNCDSLILVARGIKK